MQAKEHDVLDTGRMKPVQSDDHPPIRMPKSEPNARTPANVLPATPHKVNVMIAVVDADTPASSNGEM